MKEKKNKTVLDDIQDAMDIVRGMTQEEIRELLLRNPLYKYLVEMDKGNNKDDTQEKCE